MSLDFPKLFHEASVRARRDVAATCFVFPKTESLERNKPVTTTELDSLSTDSYDTLKDWIKTNPHLIRVGAREDLILCMDVMKDLHDELHFDQFDSIQIYRSGLELVSIKNKSMDVGVSVYLEINDYRRRLYQVTSADKNRIFNFFVQGGFALLGGVIALFLNEKLLK